jgi:antitoxin (DNA-binding transcriptional repressor) of toxin-antitoxin stability system
MNMVKIADLKNNLSRHLVHVRNGGEITVLDREKPIARIVPFSPRHRPGRPAKDDYWTDDRLEALERHGTLRRGDAAAAAGWLDDVRPAKLPSGSPGAVETLLAMRRASTR